MSDPMRGGKLTADLGAKLKAAFTKEVGITYATASEWQRCAETFIAAARSTEAGSATAAGGAEFQPMETAPKNRPILVWSEVDGGDRVAGYGWQRVHWYPGGDEGDICGEEGGWLVSCTDDRPAIADSPKAWCELPAAPNAAPPAHREAGSAADLAGLREALEFYRSNWILFEGDRNGSFEPTEELKKDGGALASHVLAALQPTTAGSGLTSNTQEPSNGRG